MKRWNHHLLLLTLGGPCLVGDLTVLPLKSAQHWLLVFALGAMFIWASALFLAGLVSLLGTRKFLRTAASAKGRVSDIYEVTPTGASAFLFSGRLATVQFWTEQEQSIAFHSHTFQENPQTAAGSVPVLYDPKRPSEAKIRSFEGLWLMSGLVMVVGVGFLLLFADLFLSVLR